MDYIIRGTAAGGQIRAFACVTAELAEKARQIHGTSPVATAALGRLLSGSVMMGIMMKGDKDILTVMVKGDGPLGGLTVTADSKGRVKGYPYNPEVLIHANEKGKLDVGGAVGRGTLTVIKDLGLKEPYIGQVDLQTGEIADDLTYYFALSEQVPSAVGLGVLMNKNNTVAQAGGFIIQLMPGTGEDVISQLEKQLAGVDSVTNLLAKGYTPEMLLNELLAGMEPEILEKIPAEYACNCSYDRMAKALISVGKEELESMIADGKSIELKCQFCGSAYTFTVDDLKEMVRAAEQP